MTDTTLFGETPADTSKYANWEIEALRKKAEAADLHIRTLEAEAAERRELVTNEATLQEVLRKLDMVSQPPATYVQPAVHQTPVLTSTQSGQTLTAKDVEDILNQKQKELQAKANVDRVKGTLQKVWGDDFSLRLSEKSKEIGVNQGFLASMAEEYPEAFLKLVLEGKTNTNPNSHVPPSSMSTPTGSFAELKGETRKDFRAAEKANPALVTDPSFQARKHAAAQRLGDAFFA